MGKKPQQYTIAAVLENPIGDTFVLAQNNILSIVIVESVLSILPKIKIVMNNTGSFIDAFPIHDGDKISLIITDLADEIVINTQFTISSFTATQDVMENITNTFTISGYLSLGMYNDYKFTAYTGSSDEVLELMSEVAGYSNFEKRVSGSDSMIWYRHGNAYQFINHVADRSFIDGDGVFVYGDTKKNLIYTSYGTELVKNAKYLAVYDRNTSSKNVSTEETKHVLNYGRYDVQNNTHIYNNYILYGGVYQYYDTESIKEVIVNVDTKITDFYNKIKDKTPILLHSVGLISEEKLQTTLYKGQLLNVMHKYALFSVNFLLRVNSSIPVQLFDKVNFMLPATSTPDGISESYSGEYSVGAITHIVEFNKPLRKDVLICRQGINSTSQDTLIKDIV